MERGKYRTIFASLAGGLWMLLIVGLSLAQEVPAPGGGEPAKVEAPAVAPGAPAEAAAKKEDPPAQFTQGLLEQIGGTKVAMDTMWTLIAGMLVFFMNLGFAMVESGLCRAKNAVTILAKNFIVFAASSIAFLVLGWGLMFGDGNPFFGTEGLWFVGGVDNSPAMGDAYKGVYSSINWTGIPLWTKFFFQLVFAGTAATIVSGAVAERIKFGAFYIFTFLMVGIIYPLPVTGSGVGVGRQSLACSTLPARRWFTRWEAGRHWRESSFWVLVSESIVKTARCCRYRVTVWLWQRWGFSCCGLAGSGLIQAARWRRMPVQSVGLR